MQQRLKEDRHDDEDGEYSLLQELLDKPTDQSGSHLDILLDFIAGSPARVASLHACKFVPGSGGS